MNKVKNWWKNTTRNEKLMYGLILAFAVGIVVRWDFITEQVGEALHNMYTPNTEQVTEE